MERKYRALRIVATIFKVLAWITLVIGVLGAILFVVGVVWLSISGMGMQGPIAPYYYRGLGGAPIVVSLIGALGIALGPILSFLFLYASAEMIYLFLDIEQNTRETAYHLQPKL